MKEWPCSSTSRCRERERESFFHSLSYYRRSSSSLFPATRLLLLLLHLHLHHAHSSFFWRSVNGELCFPRKKNRKHFPFWYNNVREKKKDADDMTACWMSFVYWWNKQTIALLLLFFWLLLFPLPTPFTPHLLSFSLSYLSVHSSPAASGDCLSYTVIPTSISC